VVVSHDKANHGGEEEENGSELHDRKEL